MTAPAAVSAGARLRVIAGAHAGREGTVTKVNGPKTVELRLDAGFTLWHVKLSNTERTAAHRPGQRVTWAVAGRQLAAVVLAARPSLARPGAYVYDLADPATGEVASFAVPDSEVTP